MLTASKVPSYVSIPKGVPEAVAKNSKDARAVAALYCLKGSLTCGRIKNYYALRATLAANFGISARTLDKHVARLEEMGHLWKHYRYAKAPTSYDLVLRSSKHLATEEGTCTTKYHKVQFTTLHDLLLKLYTLGLKEDKSHPEHAIVKNRKNDYITSNRTSYSASNMHPAARKRALCGYDDAAAAALQVSHFAKTVASTDYINQERVASPYADKSLFGMMKVFGCKSKTTCARRLAAMKAAGLIEVKPCRIATDYPADKVYYAWLREEIFKGDYSYRRIGNVIYKIMPNTVTFLPSITL